MNASTWGTLMLNDWGHARDYAEMQWRMLQQETPEDFVIATGRQESVRKFMNSRQKHWAGVDSVGRERSR